LKRIGEIEIDLRGWEGDLAGGERLSTDLRFACCNRKRGMDQNGAQVLVREKVKTRR